MSIPMPVMEIIVKYARLWPSGNPKRCTSTPEHWRGDGKIIYRNMDSARQAAQELAALGDGRPMFAYECPRSRNGHAHLSRRKQS